MQEKIEEFAKNKRIVGFWIDPEIDLKKQDSLWYGGEVLQYTLDEQYHINIEAIGDVRVTAYFRNGEILDLVDKSNSGYTAIFSKFPYTEGMGV